MTYKSCVSILLVLNAVAAAAVAYAAAPHVVSQRDRQFRPGNLVVQQGDIVRFPNDDKFTHHAYVKSPNFNFDSGEISPGDVVEVRMTVRDTFEVRCAIHPKMRLVIKVE